MKFDYRRAKGTVKLRISIFENLNNLIICYRFTNLYMNATLRVFINYNVRENSVLRRLALSQIFCIHGLPVRTHIKCEKCPALWI